MRAIAIAVLMGTWGIECAIRGKELPATNEFTGFVTVIFVFCLVFGW